MEKSPCFLGAPLLRLFAPSKVSLLHFLAISNPKLEVRISHIYTYIYTYFQVLYIDNVEGKFDPTRPYIRML